MAELLIALVIVAGLVVAHVSSRAALRISEARSSGRLTLPPFLDLDGDLKADGISLFSNGFDKTVRIRFGNSRTRELKFVGRTSDTGSIVAYDINHDGYVDLIWASESSKNAVVLENDGQGNFSAATDTTHYAAELDALLSTDAPSDYPQLRSEHQAQISTNASPQEAARVDGDQLCAPNFQNVSTRDFGCPDHRSPVLTYLRKRGPPFIS